jgi:hypothetical protein
MNELTGNTRHNFITDLDAGHAREVKAAYFRQGDEDEIVTQFYRLWGRVVRVVSNRRTTMTRFYWVGGEALDIFDSYYPETV